MRKAYAAFEQITTEVPIHIRRFGRETGVYINQVMPIFDTLEELRKAFPHASYLEITIHDYKKGTTND